MEDIALADINSSSQSLRDSHSTAPDPDSNRRLTTCLSFSDQAATRTLPAEDKKTSWKLNDVGIYKSIF